MKAYKCQAFKSCRRRSRYDSPTGLCSKHWHMWWDYGVKPGKPQPAFVRRLDALFEFEARCAQLEAEGR